MFMPFNILGIWFRALLAPVLLGGGIYLLSEWFRNRETVVLERQVVAAEQGEETVDRGRVVPWQVGLNKETAFLVGGLALIAWSLGGGLLLSPHSWRRRDNREPQPVRSSDLKTVRRADGTELHV